MKRIGTDGVILRPIMIVPAGEGPQERPDPLKDERLLRFLRN